MFKVITNKDGQIQEIQTSLSAHELMDNPLLNKGTAFSKEERDAFDLHGKLPIQVESLSSQLMRVYRQFQEKNDNIQKNIFLNTLHDSNTTLFL